MSDTDKPEICFVVSARQLVAAVLMLFTLTVVVAIVVSVIGGMVRPPSAVARSEAPDTEAILVVDGMDSPAESKPAKTADGEWVLVVDSPSAPRREPETEARAGCQLEPGSYFASPAIGDLYLQVAAAGRGVAGVFAAYLDQEGVPVLVSEAPEAGTYRVLVGPLGGSEETAELKAKLEGLEFQPFLRRIR
jgi:hypothetical protein